MVVRRSCPVAILHRAHSPAARLPAVERSGRVQADADVAGPATHLRYAASTRCFTRASGELSVILEALIAIGIVMRRSRPCFLITTTAPSSTRSTFIRGTRRTDTRPMRTSASEANTTFRAKSLHQSKTRNATSTTIRGSTNKARRAVPMISNDSSPDSRYFVAAENCTTSFTFSAAALRRHTRWLGRSAGTPPTAPGGALQHPSSSLPLATSAVPNCNQPSE